MQSTNAAAPVRAMASPYCGIVRREARRAKSVSQCVTGRQSSVGPILGSAGVREPGERTFAGACGEPYRSSRRLRLVPSGREFADLDTSAPRGDRSKSLLDVCLNAADAIPDEGDGLIDVRREAVESSRQMLDLAIVANAELRAIAANWSAHVRDAEADRRSFL